MSEDNFLKIWHSIIKINGELLELWCGIYFHLFREGKHGYFPKSVLRINSFTFYFFLLIIKSFGVNICILRYKISIFL